MKKLLKVFSLVLVFAVICAAIFAVCASAKFASSENFTESETTVEDMKDSIVVGGIGSTYGDGNDNGQIDKYVVVEKDTGLSYVKLSPKYDTNTSDLIIYYDLGNDRMDLKYGDQTAYYVLEFDVATEGVGMQFTPAFRHRYGEWDGDVFNDKGGATTSKSNWFYNQGGPTMDTRLPNAGQWYHVTMIGQILEGGELVNTYYHYIDGVFQGTNTMSINTSKFAKAGDGIRFNQAIMEVGFKSLSYKDEMTLLIANVQAKTYMQTGAAVDAIKASIAAKNTNAWDASDGIRGEYALPNIAAQEAEVTVNIDGKTYTGTYFVGATMEEAANAIAKQNGVIFSEKIIVTPNGDGTFEIVPSIVWSSSSNVVTAGTNTATGTRSTPAYVIVDDNYNVTATGNTGEEFVKAVENSTPMNIILTSDIYVPNGTGSDKNQAMSVTRGVTKNIYLNGYTLSNNGTIAGGSHLFVVYSNGSTLNVEGPGTIDKSGEGNIVFGMNHNISTSFKNLVINHNSPSVVSAFMFRTGKHVFDNTVINAYGCDVMFNIGHSNGSNLDVQLINGTEINMLRNPSHVFAGGSTAAGGKVTVDGAYINAYDAVFSTAGADSIPIYVKNTVIYATGTYVAYNKGIAQIGENVVLSNIDVNIGKGYTSIADIVASGYVIAKSNESNYYVTAKAEDCATVYWGDSETPEYWMNYSVPIASANYGVYAVSWVEAGKEYRFDKALTNPTNLFMNLTLNTGFGVNIYIPTDSKVVSVYYAGESYEINDATPTAMVGEVECYVFTAEVAPADAGELLPVAALFENDEVATWKVSFAHYAQRVLKNPDRFVKEQQIIIDAIEYAIAANNYFTHLPSKANLNAVKGLIEEGKAATTYADAKTNTEWAGIDVDNTGLSTYFDSVQVVLTSSPKLRLNIADNANGELQLWFWNNVEDWNNYETAEPFMLYTATIVDGMIDGKDYIEFEFYAFNMYRFFEVIVDEGNGCYATWDISRYVDACKNTPEQAVVEALYAYCYSAAKYEAAKA